MSARCCQCFGPQATDVSARSWAEESGESVVVYSNAMGSGLPPAPQVPGTEEASRCLWGPLLPAGPGRTPWAVSPAGGEGLSCRPRPHGCQVSLNSLMGAWPRAQRRVSTGPGTAGGKAAGLQLL